MIGISFLVSNDVEGLFFLEENGTRHRLGQNLNMGYYPSTANFDLFNGRFKGFEARYRVDSLPLYKPTN